MQELIFDEIDGNLGEEQADELNLHLSTCPECRKLRQEYLDTIESIKLQGKEVTCQHITNEELVDYVDDPRELSEAQREMIELHLDLCHRCQKKVSMLRQIDRESSAAYSEKEPGTSIPWFRKMSYAITNRPVVVIASAAALLLAILIPLGYVLRLHYADESRLEIITDKDVVWLSELTRTSQVKPEVIERDGYIRVGLRYQPFFENENYWVRLRSSSEEVILNRRLNSGDFNPAGELILQLKTSDLDPGELHLIIIAVSPDNRVEYSRSINPFILVKD